MKRPAPDGESRLVAALAAVQALDRMVVPASGEYRLALLCRLALEQYKRTTGKEYDHSDWL